MDIRLDPHIRQISAMRAGRFAAPEEQQAAAAQPQDAVALSQAGRQAAAEAAGGADFGETAEKLEAQLQSMTKADFQSMVRRQLGERQLEVNWNAAVDPDGSIWAKSYIEALHAQREAAGDAVRDYYAGACQEALRSSDTQTGRLHFLAGKYLCSWSDNFAADMPAAARQWTYDQVKAMLTGGRVKLNDPCALAAAGLDAKNMDRAARQTASDRVADLIRQAKACAAE